MSIRLCATVLTATMAESPDKPLRADAARNHELILAAAAELFAERGLSASLNDVAHHAGVGVGTVYRHFPHKDELIETLLEARVEEYAAIGEAGLADPDPWHGLVTGVVRSLELRADDRGLHELVQASPQPTERVARVRARMLPIGEELVRRAQAAGAIRSDVTAADLGVIQLMVGAVSDAAVDVDPDLWRRYLALVLRGLATRPDELEPLDVAAPTSAQFDQLMASERPPVRPVTRR